jgi:hypothetical protein
VQDAIKVKSQEGEKMGVHIKVNNNNDKKNSTTEEVVLRKD